MGTRQFTVPRWPNATFDGDFAQFERSVLSGFVTGSMARKTTIRNDDEDDDSFDESRGNATGLARDGQLDVRVAGAIGAVFDFYAGRIRRSHPLFQRLGLEWLPRLLQEPRRLWRRTFVSAPRFLWAAARNRVSTPPRSP